MNSHSARPPGTLVAAELALLLTVSIWGLTIVATKIGLRNFEPLVFVVLRFSLGVLVTAVYVLPRTGLPKFESRDLRPLLIAAFLGIVVNQIGFVSALRLTSAVNTSLLLGTIAVWATATALVLGFERPTRRHWLVLGAGAVGVALIVLGGPQGNFENTSLMGDLMAIFAAMAWAIYTVQIGPLRERYSALSLSLFMIAAGTVMLLPLASPQLLTQRWSELPLSAWLALIFAAGPGVALTNVLYFNAIMAVGPSRAAVYTYLIPFLGVIFAVVLLGERATLAQIFGGVVVVLAVAAGRRHSWVSVGGH